MRKKYLSVLLCFILALAVVGTASCKSSDSQETADAKKTTITWWCFPVFSEDGGSGSYERKLIEAFEKEHPNISVKLEMLDYATGPDKIQAALDNKVAADVLLDAPGRIISYGKEGYLASLNDLFTEEFVTDVDNEALINACLVGDKAYMYPLSSAPFYMAFNKSMLEEAGVLDLVQEGFTTDDFTKVVTALRKEGYVAGSVFYDGQGGDQGTRAFIANLYSSSVMNEDSSRYTINNTAGVEGLAYVKKAVESGMLVNGSRYDGTEAIENFVNGKAAFTLLWGPSQQNSYADVLEANEIETLEVPYPSEDGTPELEYLINGLCVFDNGDEKRIEAATEFVRFLCDDAVWGPKNVVQSGCIPVRNTFGELYTDERMVTIESWSKYYAPYYNTVDGFQTMRVAWQQMLGAMLIDNESPKQAADEFVRQANIAVQPKEGGEVK